MSKANEKEAEEYRAQVRSYLETGRSDTLPEEDKRALDEEIKAQQPEEGLIGWVKRKLW